jgi:hypothetical protein
VFEFPSVKFNPRLALFVQASGSTGEAAGVSAKADGQPIAKQKNRGKKFALPTSSFIRNSFKTTIKKLGSYIINSDGNGKLQRPFYPCPCPVPKPGFGPCAGS